MCNEALRLDRRLAGAHYLVGLIATARQDRQTAARAFNAVTEIEPGHTAAWAHLARLLAQRGDIAGADEALVRAMANPGEMQPNVCDSIAWAYSQLGELHAADEWFRRATLGSGNRVAARVNYTNNLIYLGRFDEAHAQIADILRRDPDNAQAHWILAGSRKAQDRSHVDQMAAILDEAKPDPKRCAFLCYGIGKELEDLEDWDAAFEAFCDGAAARRKTVDYDERTEVDAFAALHAHYTADWLNERPAGCPDPSPIFILGQPRTGTTLVERIVTAHSDVHSAGELQQFGNVVRYLSGVKSPERYSPELFREGASIDFRSAGERFLKRIGKLRGDTARFVDKLPPNFMFLPHILAALPNAKIIHLVRDPRDALFAIFKQLFADAYPHSYDLQELARHLVRYRRLMETWRERFPGRFLDVHYEDVVVDFEPKARQIIEYLQLPWEEACLEFHRSQAAVNTASAVQVRHKVHSKSVGRWRRYQRQLAPGLRILEDAGVV